MKTTPGHGSSGRPEGRKEGQVKSLHRALDLLEALAAGERELPLSYLAQRFGLPPSTVHRLLATLVQRGYVAQNPETGRYRVGARAFEVGTGFLQQWQLREVARPAMAALAEETGETVSLAIYDGGSAVYVDQVESGQMVRLFSRIGARVPLHCTGVGKVLLSRFSEWEIRAMIRRQGMKPYTPQTLTRLEDLLAEIREVARQGYALDRQEFSEEVACAAAPVLNHQGEMTAALSVAGPTYRITPERLLVLADQVRAAARRLSIGLGFSGDQPLHRVIRP